MHELLSKSATQIAWVIRGQEVSSEEISRAALERIDEVNPKLNAVVALAAERAMDEARQRDAQTARGESMGPLHGVPITLKDSHDTEGIVTTGGTTGRAGKMPDADSPPVARLRAAGAVVLGKTNTPEFTMSFITENLVYGKTNNPYDVTRTPGGSSGGAAAIVAACGAFLELGSDLGGSVRVPANYCGIAGLKTSAGRVPRTGHAFPWGGPLDRFGTVGPLARRVEDLKLALSIISGPDWIDPFVEPVPIRDPDEVSVAGLRVAFFTDNGWQTPTAEVQEAVRSAAGVLSATGAHVEENCPDAVTRASDLARQSFGADGGYLARKLLSGANTSEPSRFLSERAGGPPEDGLSVEQYAALMHEVDATRSEIVGFMKNFDAIICPVAAQPAPTHEDAEGLGYSYTQAHNLSGLPGAVVRGGISPEGLPIGVQIVAQPWREDVALAVAAVIEEATGGWEPPAL
ncbi:MAG: amidase [Dehalococcoidia bacterium]|jgi:amidase|nr:amidase [Dehalococcoidia bacterium]